MAFKKNSLTLTGAVAMGTGVMIGAGIFALTGQMAELSGKWFPLAFIASGLIAGFSAYSYIKMSRVFPSSGGIAMFLKREFGKSTTTGGAALLMFFSMIINESLVARTFGTYSLQLFGIDDTSSLVPILGVGLLVVALIINLLKNSFIQSLSFVMSFVKIIGILIFALGGLFLSESVSRCVPKSDSEFGISGFLGATALGILAYKGFTTITNSGSEIKKPEKNIGRAIVISILICLVVYILVSVAVSCNLSIEEIVKAKNYSLAEAARPAFGDAGLLFTVIFAVVATISGIIASIFAVSRMFSMLEEMGLAPKIRLGFLGDVHENALYFIVGSAILLTIFFDLSRIASLGAVFYIVMDIQIHWGLIRHLREEVDVNIAVLITAILLDAVVLGFFLWVKAQTDMTIVMISVGGVALVFALEKIYLSYSRKVAMNDQK